jgi:N4-gp56 family major capsid protein
MSQTAVLKGDALARKLYSVALFAQTQRLPGFGRMLTGPVADAGQALSKIKGQSVPDMPIVRVTDLSKTAGDTVSVDLFGVIGGKPISGDQIAEGRGEKLTSSSMDININLMTKAVDAGGKMSQQRTLQDLRTIAMAQLTNYFARLDDQSSLVHMAGARGFQSQNDWVVPLAADADFSDVMVNTVKAPTFNRHFVANGAALSAGGVRASSGGSIATTDLMRLELVDAIRTYIDELEYPLQPVRIADDPAAADDPMWVMFVSPRQYSALLTQASGTTIRTFQQNAWNRASYGSKHPLFRGEVGMWNGILVKKLNRAIRFYSPATALGSAYNYIAAGANAITATETQSTIAAAITSGFAVDRALVLGAQALGNVYGKNKSSDYFFSWLERRYNFERNLEVAGDCMGGKAKLRFNYDESGVATPTDHGVIALDTVVAL